MSDIIKRENNLILKQDGKLVIPKNLSISNKERELYLSGKNFPKICEIQDMNVVVKQIHTFVNITIMDKGVTIPFDEQNYIKQRVTEDIIRDFTRYTLEEIKLAFYYGVRGEMGDFFGLNPSTFYKWLKDFRYELLPPVNKVVEKYLPKPDYSEIKMSEKELDKAISEKLIKEFKRLRDNDVYSYYDFGNFGYKFLERMKLLDLSVEQKNKLMKESQIQFRQNLIKRNRELTMKGKNIQKLDLNRAFEQLEQSSNPTFENQIKIGAMRIAVYNYIKKCVDDNFDLEKEINKKLKNYNYDDNSKRQ